MQHISDSERQTQIQLNKKLLEIKIKDQEIEELKDTIHHLNSRLEDNGKTIDILCRQISSLVTNQHITHA